MKLKILLWTLIIMICIAGVSAGNYSAPNFTGSILEQNFNLTPLMTTGTNSAIDNPPNWLAHWNQQLGNWGLVTFLYCFTALLFLIVRRRPEVKDSEATLYAGLVGSVLGVMLFVINITVIDGYKLITWGQLLPIIVITAFAIMLNMANRNY